VHVHAWCTICIVMLINAQIIHTVCAAAVALSWYGEISKFALTIADGWYGINVLLMIGSNNAWQLQWYTMVSVEASSCIASRPIKAKVLHLVFISVVTWQMPRCWRLLWTSSGVKMDGSIWLHVSCRLRAAMLNYYAGYSCCSTR